MSDRTDAQQTDGVRWGLTDVIVWLALTIIATLALSQPKAVVLFGSSTALAIVGTVLPWIILIVAVFVSTYHRGRRSISRDFGFRFRWIDLAWGLMVGLLLRAVSTLIDIGAWGHLPGSGAHLEGSMLPLALVTLFALGSIAISPVVEELFFRGLVLRALLRALPGSRRELLARCIAVAVSAVAFSSVHVLAITSPTAFIVTGMTTFVVGVALGSLAIATDRLGGTVIAHVVFNASGVALNYLT